MRYTVFTAMLLFSVTACADKAPGTLPPCTPQQQNECDCPEMSRQADGLRPATEGEALMLTPAESIRIRVVGQGVAPVTTTSPAQAYALAKRAAIADAYRLIAEKVKGVHVEGQDQIKNMMVKRSDIRTSVDAMIRDAHIAETIFKEGLCEVEMELRLSYSQFAR